MLFPNFCSEKPGWRACKVGDNDQVVGGGGGGGGNNQVVGGRGVAAPLS